MKIYVLHYSKLIERKKSILEQFEKHNITDYEFIEKYDKDDIQDLYKNLFIKISIGSASLILKHFFAYREIMKHHDQALIFEDDVILSDNFIDIFNKYINELPNDYDMLFIGDGCKLHIPKKMQLEGQHIYSKTLQPTNWGGNGATRCTDSYVLSKKGATALVKYIDSLKKKIHLPIDWWLNHAARETNLNVYWAEPTIVTQGSELGLFKSSYKL